MADTAVTFSIIGRDRGAAAALARIRSAFQSTGRQAQQAMSQAQHSTERLDRQIEEVERDLRVLNAEFAATGNRELFAKMKRDRSLLTQLRQVRKELKDTDDATRRLGDGSSRTGSLLSGALGGALSMLSGGANDAGTAVTNLTTNLWNWIPAIAASIAALVAAGPAVTLFGGAVGAIPGILAGAAGAFGALKLGTMGLTDEYTRLTTATGGGGAGGAVQDLTPKLRAVQSAQRDVTRATRELADSQKAARTAQLAINAARKQAAEDLDDMSRSLRGARLDEEDATAAVTKATQDLAVARAQGTPDEINEADRNYRRALLTLDETRDRVQDLSAEQTDAQRKGVAGSDVVVAAEERHRQAVQAVTDAQERQREAVQRLADARKELKAPQGGGGGGGGGAQAVQLAPAARKFLDTVLALRPAFDRLRLDVQQRLFAGLSSRLQNLADAWLPTLHRRLGGFAGTLNGIAKTLFSSVTKKSFIENIDTGAKAAQSALGEVGRVVAGPLMDAFGRLSRAAAPFIRSLGHEIAGVVKSFSDWIAQADRSGKLDKFFRDASFYLHEIFGIGTEVFRIIGGLFSAMSGSQLEDNGKTGIEKIHDALKSVADWLADPGNQKKVRDFFDTITVSIHTVISALKTAKGWIDRISGWISSIHRFGTSVGNAMTSVKNGVTSAKNWIVARFNDVVGYVRGLPSRIGRAASGMWNGITSSFRSALNWIIGRWNGLQFTLPGFSFAGMSVPGFSLGTPDIPYLAKGGNVSRSGLAVVGEEGPELLTLSAGAQVTPLRGRPTGERTVRLEVVGERDIVTFLKRLIRTANLLEG